MKKYNVLAILIILGVQLLFPKDASIFLKQVELEKIYSSKVTNFLKKMYDPKDFYVFADVQLVDKTALENTSKASESQEAANPYGYTFIEGLGLDGGLPTLPSSGTTEKNPNQIDLGDYDIKALRISVYLSESVYSVEGVEVVSDFVSTNIQEIRNCFECFTLEKIPNKNGNFSQDDDRYTKLESDLKKALSKYESMQDSIKWAVYQEEQEALRSEIKAMQDISKEARDLLLKQLKDANDASNREKDLLERQIDEATSARDFWEDQEARRRQLQRNLDSLKFVSLQEIEKEYRTKQNELLSTLSIDYENAVQSRLNDSKETQNKLFNLVEHGSTKTPEASRGLPWWVWIVIPVVCALFLLIMFLLLRKKKVVYLKPRNTKPDPPAGPQPFTAPPTESNENNDVVRSEVRSLRQSTVTMSAGQKEGASQIISDWLDEGSSDDDNEENNTEEE